MSALPEIGRRRLLLGLAAASTTAAVASVSILPAMAAAAEPVATENPELLRLGDALPAIEAEYREARRARKEVINEWWYRWPVAPESIVNERESWSGDGLERMFTGATILPDRSMYEMPAGDAWRKPHPKPRRLHLAEDFEMAIERITRAIKRKRKNPFAPINAGYLGPIGSYDRLAIDEWELVLAQMTAAHADAVAYEAEKARVLEASGWESADARMTAASKAFGGIVAEIMAQPETTMAGIIIKAQALAGWGQVDPLTRLTGDGGGIHRVMAWEAEFAVAVLRIAGGEA